MSNFFKHWHSNSKNQKITDERRMFKTTGYLFALETEEKCNELYERSKPIIMRIGSNLREREKLEAEQLKKVLDL